jgi:hypothetical protein
MTPWGLLEPDARTTGTSGSQGGGASQGAPPTRQGLWTNLKGVELANFAGDTVVEVADAAERGVHRVCDNQQLVWSFLAHTGLTLDDQNPPNL